MRIAAAVIALVGAGCNWIISNDDFTGVDAATAGGDGGGGGDGGTSSKYCEQIDLVFIVDDSGSMQEEQANLAANLPMVSALLSSYKTPDGHSVDYRVAVTTTGRDVSYKIEIPGMPPFPQSEMGDDGAFRDTCGSSKRWVERADADGATRLACRANVGTAGPSLEMPLLMTRFALADRVSDGVNAGFVRPDALLAIVMLTDEDDQSITQNDFTIPASGAPPVDYQPTDLIAFLDGLKGDRSRWAATVIAGDGDCNSAFGAAANAARLKQLVVTASPQATFSSICAGDLTIGLSKALTLFQTACVGASHR